MNYTEAAAVVDAITPAARRAIAIHAVQLAAAEDKSMADPGYRVAVHGIIHSAAPSFSIALRTLLRHVRRYL